MFDDAAQALEESEPEDKARSEILYARVNIFLAAKKWHVGRVLTCHLLSKGFDFRIPEPCNVGACGLIICFPAVERIS